MISCINIRVNDEKKKDKFLLDNIKWILIDKSILKVNSISLEMISNLNLVLLEGRFGVLYLFFVNLQI